MRCVSGDVFRDVPAAEGARTGQQRWQCLRHVRWRLLLRQRGVSARLLDGRRDHLQVAVPRRLLLLQQVLRAGLKGEAQDRLLGLRLRQRKVPQPGKITKEIFPRTDLELSRYGLFGYLIG